CLRFHRVYSGKRQSKPQSDRCTITPEDTLKDGDPVTDALLSNITGNATTDEFGYFQAGIESDTRSLDVRTRSMDCRATLPDFDTKETVVMLEELVCR
ncbi:MAG: hypothetical protein ACI8Z1_001248, partial [Candidatus Azotimanducaceae bacterium]